MKKILYIEDMKECYEKTKDSIGKDFEIDWKENPFDAIKAITRHLPEYSAAIVDVNLSYNPKLPLDKQSAEGLFLIGIIKQESKRQGVDIPIICASRNGELYKEPSINAGANAFLWKKELWEGKGKEVLEKLVKKV
jgi:CheY-like chemotaxis protein